MERVNKVTHNGGTRSPPHCISIEVFLHPPLPFQQFSLFLPSRSPFLKISSSAFIYIPLLCVCVFTPAITRLCVTPTSYK
jgi:hypothetical protein